MINQLKLLDQAILDQINRLDSRIDQTRDLYFELKELIFQIQLQGGTKTDGIN